LFSTSKGYVVWIGLNPSIADEQQLDPTLRRILGFTKQLGLQRFVMLNLFALVSTDPQVMLKLRPRERRHQHSSARTTFRRLLQHHVLYVVVITLHPLP
jgi:hypothetical protein